LLASQSVLFILVAAILAVASVAAAAVLTFLRTRELLRRFRAFGASVDEALAVVTAGAERLSAQSATVGGTGELDLALARLAVSRRRLAVLLEAVEDIRGLVGRVTGLRPVK
jgi:hypothetical protein